MRAHHLTGIVVALLACSPAGAATTEVQLAPGIDASSQRNLPIAGGTTYTITVSGLITETFGATTCEYDFAYSKCNAQQFASHRDGTGIKTHSPAPFSGPGAGQNFSDLASPYPAFREDHTYTFTFTEPAQVSSKERALWAIPAGVKHPQNATYSGSFTVKHVGDPPAPTPSPSPTPDPCGGRAFAVAAQSCKAPPPCKPAVARAAAINEVRVVAVQPGVAFHRAGRPDDEWCEAEKDDVLKQGDEISCDPDGAVTLQFADNSTVVVRNTSQLKIASFFTEGGVVRTEILLRMGEVAAKVNKSEATKSDFRIKEPTGIAGVRGTTFSVSYDPGSKASITSVYEGVVEYDPVNPKLPTVNLTAGQEVEVTPKSMSKVAAIGKAGARGGVNRGVARDKVLAAVAKGNAGCKITTLRSNAYSIKPAKGGWTASVKVTGKLKGTSKWLIKRKRAKPVNKLAKRIAKSCR